MEKRNIYKADDVLIIGSLLMLIPAVYMAWPWLAGITTVTDWYGYVLSAPEILGINLFMSLFCLDSAVTAQIVGRILRHREKLSLDILDTVMYMGSATVSQVAGNLSLSEDRVRSLAQRLTRVRDLNLKMEGDVISRELFPGAGSPSTRAAEPSSVTAPTAEEQGAGSAPEPKKVPSNGEFLSEDLREFLRKDKSDMYGKIAMLKKINETGGKITPEELKDLPPASPENTKKIKGRMILLFFLFVTPLWPVALIITIVYVVKQYKTMKNKGLIQPKES